MGIVEGIMIDLDALTGPAEPGTIVRRQAFADRDEYTYQRSEQ